MLLALRSLWDISAIPSLPNPPGRVIKGPYPYWRPARKPIYEGDPEQEIEELIVLIGMEL